jgi:hypothetical protein
MSTDPGGGGEPAIEMRVPDREKNMRRRSHDSFNGQVEGAGVEIWWR